MLILIAIWIFKSWLHSALTTNLMKRKIILTILWSCLLHIAPNALAQGYYKIQLKSSGKYLDAVQCSDQIGLNPGSDYAGGACQLWRLVPAGDGWYRIQLKSGGKYLDAVRCSDQVGLNPGSNYAGGACQLWRLVPAG